MEAPSGSLLTFSGMQSSKAVCKEGDNVSGAKVLHGKTGTEALSPCCCGSETYWQAMKVLSGLHCEKGLQPLGQCLVNLNI